MRLDKFSNPIFNEIDIFQAMYRGKTITADMFVEHSTERASLEQTMEVKFLDPLDDYDISVEEYDAAMQTDWLMPEEYKNMDIENFLVQNSNKAHYQRLMDELAEFRARNLMDLLRWLKYFVDTCEKNNIVWGVGRGSSVASYVLFVIGVHSIDPIEYNLDWRDFLR